MSLSDTLTQKQELTLTELKQQIKILSDLVKTQGSSGNWNYNNYMHGMFNGMELALAVIEDREPVYRDAPEVRLDSLPSTEEILAEESSEKLTSIED